MILISKSFEFSASHTLSRPEWSVEKNIEVFGKCAHPNGHGHNYTLEVYVAGELDEATQMIIDASLLSQIVEDRILRYVDHRNLNLDVPWLKGKIPTSEVLVDAIWNELAPEISKAAPKARLYELRLQETKRICAVRRSE